MKTAILKAPGRIEIEEKAAPEPGPGEILIRVKAAGICRSEIHAYDGLHPRRQPPVVLGHEFASSTYLHRDYLDALGLLRSKSKEIESIVTHRVPFERIDEAMRMVKHRTEDVLKVIVEY